MRLELVGLKLEIAGRTIVRDVALDIPEGTVSGLIGPNGSGKSTMLRAVYRHLRPSDGLVLVGGDDCWKLPPRQVAQRIGTVPQERPVELDLTVWEMAAMGRTPHKSAFVRDDPRDHAAVAAALARVGLGDLAHRRFSELSGGEKQRVVVARALAQETPVLVLDEPTNHLDVRHQLEVLDLIGELGVTTLAAMHDLNLASTYCDVLHVLLAGELVASGPPGEVLTEDLVARVFGVGAEITVSPRTGRPQLSFHPLPPLSPPGGPPEREVPAGAVPVGRDDHGEEVMTR
jgi:iron complex transport system ATP-binding protein